MFCTHCNHNLTAKVCSNTSWANFTTKVKDNTKIFRSQTQTSSEYCVSYSETTVIYCTLQEHLLLKPLRSPVGWLFWRCICLLLCVDLKFSNDFKWFSVNQPPLSPMTLYIQYTVDIGQWHESCLIKSKPTKYCPFGGRLNGLMISVLPNNEPIMFRLRKALCSLSNLKGVCWGCHWIFKSQRSQSFLHPLQTWSTNTMVYALFIRWLCSSIKCFSSHRIRKIDKNLGEKQPNNTNEAKSCT